MAKFKKKVTKKIGHDSMYVTATYATGGNFRFSIGRNGERIGWAGSNDPKVNAAQAKAFVVFAKHRDGENNGELLERIRVAASAANDMAELAAAVGFHPVAVV